MNNQFKVFIQAVLDIPKSKKQIDADMAKLSRQIKALSLKVKPDDRSVKAAADKIKNDMEPGLNIRMDQVISDQKLETYLTKNLKLVKKLAAAIPEIQKALEHTASGAALPEKVLKTDPATPTSWSLEGGSLGESVKKHASLLSEGLNEKNIGLLLFEQLGDGISFVTDLDSALTAINQTMPVTSAQLGRLGQDAIDAAKELKVSSSDMLYAVSLYANPGETPKSALNKAKPTVMLSNTSGIDLPSSSDMIKNAISQFGLAENQALHVGDVYEKVAGNIALNLKQGISEIAQAVQVSGSAAKEAGLELEDYASMAAKVIEQINLPGAAVGTSLETMFGRIGNAGSADVSAKDIKTAESALNAVGVAVRNDTGSFRDMGSILDDLSGKWNSLTEIQKDSIAAGVAGNGSATVFQGLMDSYDEYLALVGQADQAAGTLYQNQSHYEETITARTQELTANLQSFWNTVIDSDTVKTAIDLLSSFIGGLDQLSGFLGGIGTIGVGAGILAFVKNLD